MYACMYVTIIFPSHNSYERDDSANEDCRVIVCKVRVPISCFLQELQKAKRLPSERSTDKKKLLTKDKGSLIDESLPELWKYSFLK